jgi:hypothetical protein
MPLLDEPRCPQCLSVVPLRELWRTARTNLLGFLEGPVGISCPKCGIPLKVDQARVVIATLSISGGYFALAVYVGSWARTSNIHIDYSRLIPILIALAAAAYLLQRLYAPRLSRLRFVEVGESVSFPLTPLRHDNDAPNPKASLDADSGDGDGDSTSASGSPWVCAKCGEENPENFGACWKCQADRPTRASK